MREKYSKVPQRSEKDSSWICQWRKLNSHVSDILQVERVHKPGKTNSDHDGRGTLLGFSFFKDRYFGTREIAHLLNVLVNLPEYLS